MRWDRRGPARARNDVFVLMRPAAGGPGGTVAAVTIGAGPAVRGAEIGELAAVGRLFAAGLGDGYVSAEHVKGRWRAGQLLVAVEAGQVIGALTVDPGAGADEAAVFGPAPAVAAESGLVESLVVDPRVRGRGVGGALLGAALELLAGAGCRFVVSVSWVSGSAQCSAPLFDRAGFELLAERAQLWRADSLERGYRCPSCGCPCTCTGLLYGKALPGPR